MGRTQRSGEGDIDLALVAACLGGDVAAREQLIERLVELPSLVRAKNARLGAPLPEDGVEDVIQNVLLSLWAKLATYDGRVPLLSWALGFATFEILRAVTAIGRRRERAAGVVDVVDRRRQTSLESTERLAAMLGRLAPHDQELLRLKHIEEFTFAEIATRVGSPLPSVKTRYYRALEVLRRFVGLDEETVT